MAEDNLELLHLLESVMENHFQVLTAENGKEALNVLSRESVDFIISDVMMPEMDGVEFCARVKSAVQTSHIPFILLTAKSSYEHQLHGYEAGADDYIPKPFNLELMVLKVKNLLETRQKFQLQFKSTPDLRINRTLGSQSDDKFIKSAMQAVEANLDDECFGIPDLVRELGVSRTLLFEKFKALLGQTPNEFIQTIRLKYAAQLIKESDLKINEIAFKVGFSDPKYFSKIFHKQFGISPSQFKKTGY